MNRALYRSADVCTPEQLHWHRNPKSKLTESQKAFIDKYYFIPYPEDLFYKAHKETHQTFMEKLEKSSEPQKLIDALWDDPSHGTGRRGVVGLKKAVATVQKKMRKKEKMRAFARKFTDEDLTNQQLRSSGFMRSDMLY